MGKMKPLGGLCQITLGQSPASSSYNQDGEGLPFFQGNADFGIDHPVARIWCTEPRKIAHPNDLLVSVRAPIGAVNVADCECCIGRGVASIRPKDSSLNPDYLRQCLNAMSDKLASLGTGSTFTAVGKTVLNAFKVPVYPIEEQKHIAQQFTLLLQLKRVAEQMLAKADELIQSRFVEMFGDPAENSLAWPKLPLASLGDVNRGVSKHRPRNAPELLNGPYPLIQTGDVANAQLYIRDYSSTYSELGLLQSRMQKKGTLCITIAANIAQTAILDFDACFPDSVVGFVPNGRSNVIFMHYWFSFSQELIEQLASKSAQKNINLKILRSLDVIVPPLALQNEFAEFVTQVESLKATTRQQLDRLNTLYDSIAQRYFAE